MKDAIISESEAIFRLIAYSYIFLNSSRGDGSKLSSEMLKPKNHVTSKRQKQDVSIKKKISVNKGCWKKVKVDYMKVIEQGRG